MNSPDVNPQSGKYTIKFVIRSIIYQVFPVTFPHQASE